MNKKTHYRKLMNMYLSAPINGLYKPRIQLSEGEAEIIMTVDPQFFHAAHALHGSVYFKMLDDAAFFAASTLVEGVFVLTTHFTTDFFRPVTSGTLKAQGQVLHCGRHTIVAGATLYDLRNKPVAMGRGTFVRSRIPLDDKVGYSG